MHESKESEFSLYDLFVPLTLKKVIIFLITIGVVVFFNAFFNGFVWDDIGYILLNNELHRFNLLHLFGLKEFTSGGYFRPISAIYFSLFYNLFGSHAFFYHFFQISLHITNACLVYIFFSKFFKNTTAFLLAVLFLIHPIQTEAVVYIGDSQSELLFLFGITALLISLKEKFATKDFVITAILLLLALLTKETGILFVLFITLFQYLVKKRKELTFVLYSLLVIGSYLFIRLVLVKSFFEKNLTSPIGNVSLGERLLNLPNVFFYYLKTFFYPVTLGIDQRWTVTAIDLQHFYFPLFLDLVFLLAIGVVGFILYKNKKQTFLFFVFFAVWFLVSIGMLLQIFPLDMTVSERWFYIPMVGMLGIIGYAIQLISFSNKNIFRYFSITVGMIVVILSVRTMVRTTNWVDTITLYSHDIRVDDNYDLEDNLGTEYAYAGRYKEALPYLQKGVKMAPHSTNIYNLASAYYQLGYYTQAEYYYMLTLKQDDEPDLKRQMTRNAYNGLAQVYVLHKDPKEANVFMTEVLKRYPTSGTFWAYLAITDYKLGNQEKALNEAKKAREILHNSSTEKLYQLILKKKPLDLHQ